MKILFLNTSSKGGAAVACERIAIACTSVGHEVTIINQRDFADLISANGEKNLYLIRVFVLKVLGRLQQYFSRRSYTSTMVFGSVLAKTINESEFDVVHLNWVNSGFLSLRQIRRIEKPVVWTLHDMWLFTGFRHVLLDKQRLFIVEKLMRLRIQKLLALNPNISLVAPSKWLADKIGKCYGINVEVIPNPIGRLVLEDTFKAGISRKSFSVLFLHNSKEFHKGYDLLIRSLQVLSKTYSVELVTLVNPVPDFANVSVKTIDFVNGEKDLYHLMRSVDCVLVPSRIDNFPNVCLEALRSNTPVVAFSIGGIPEIVSHKENGYLAKPFNVHDYAAGIAYVFENRASFTYPDLISDPFKVAMLYNAIYSKAVKY